MNRSTSYTGYASGVLVATVWFGSVTIPQARVRLTSGYTREMTDNTAFVLFQQEGYLFNSALTSGLTALRNGNVSAPGRLYVAFFQLSTGLDRLMKVILILNEFATKGEPPTEAQLKRGFGHDILSLFAAVQGATLAVPQEAAAALDQHSVDFAILRFLSDFAVSERYFNLGSLTAGRVAQDPLARWDELLMRILRDEVDPRRLRLIQRTSAELGARIQEWVHIAGVDLQKQ